MVINIANHDFPAIWDKTYLFALSDYPNITDWELRKIILFIEYEKRHNRETSIVSENDGILDAVTHALSRPERFLSAQRPRKVTECTACKHKGCITDFVCHTTDIDSAKAIFKCGKLLSAVNARNQTGEELAKEARNAAGDPPDYFDYIMFAWGNCQAGDRLVMERMLNRFPDEDDVSIRFSPGVRFYFRYDSIAAHPDFVDDGFHPAKIRRQLLLSDYLYCCVVPQCDMPALQGVVPLHLHDKVFYIEHDCKDILDWTAKVYDFVCGCQHSA